MPDPDPHEPADAAARLAFADLAPVPPAAASRRPAGRVRAWAVPALMGVVVLGAVVAYLAHPPAFADPNAPRVVVEVIGLHCPVQCGLRIRGALERLPFARPGTVTTNPKDGRVVFVATSREAVDPDRVRRAVEDVGFGVRAVAVLPGPAAPPPPGMSAGGE